ncbi:ATP-binding cassette domain-containing protein [Microbacterium maritypicum]|uniref:ATP-binding cassette domain-containing protein n=1 Tax=Microbacterium maritypicum TaxID=33918 RepID=A0AAJ6AMQ3_MICMQ|nr:ATP-binding cassette domain-containing protein [Microbacterium liquefaciens]WEF20663.1 ATP-binding cassette domain-containing protein [Microbacterium liquefaciens]
MPEGQVLEFTHVTKRFNEVTAVSDFSARVEPGAVTAFLGPNGAGKTTTLRILLGQVRATSGTATIGGATYAELRQPLRTIGAVLEETVYRPRRTAERQLTIAAKANGIPLSRVGEVLSLVGLEGEGDSRIGGFSLGMRQRLSVAHALLGDPGALVFDEPANGLDPEGIRWMRLLMRRLADEGRTVLVSSHVLSEVEQVADNVLVLSKGTLVLASGIETLADPKGGSVIVDAADRAALTASLMAAGFDIEVLRSGLTVRGGDAGTVGAVAAEAGIALSTLVQRGPTLEDVFIDLMRGGRFAPNTATAPAQLAAPVPSEASAEEAAADESASEGAEDASAPAPADAVVAIPVAAAAAWAAEAAAAPAGAAVADDLAASVDTDHDRTEPDHTDHDDTEHVDTEQVADEPDAPAADVDEDADMDGATEEAGAAAQGDASADAAVVDGLETDGEQTDSEQDHDVQDEAVSFEEAPERSFDEILFGAAAPTAVNDASAEDADGVAPVSVDAPGSEELHGDEGHSGVEIFADLHDASEDDDAPASDADPDSSPVEDEDPRSAAVSSMLAAAARAYYEDEPKDYPLSAENETADSDDAPAEGAHWTVASTGVIDTVPLAESSDHSEADEPADDTSEHPESGTEESEPADGDQHHTDGDQNHTGDENHDGGEHHN